MPQSVVGQIVAINGDAVQFSAQVGFKGKLQDGEWGDFIFEVNAFPCVAFKADRSAPCGAACDGMRAVLAKDAAVVNQWTAINVDNGRDAINRDSGLMQDLSGGCNDFRCQGARAVRIGDEAIVIAGRGSQA